MPSFEHDFVVQLLREHPRLAIDLLRDRTGIPVAHEQITVDDSNLTRVAPTVFLADLVLLLRDRGLPAMGIVVEVQLRIDPTKRFSWPSYVTNLRSRHRCAATLLVIAPDPSVAAWARRSIGIGHPGFQLTPVVIGPEDIPRMRDPKAASARPELSMLSALILHDVEIGKVAANAIKHVPSDVRAVYSLALDRAFGRRR